MRGSYFGRGDFACKISFSNANTISLFKSVTLMLEVVMLIALGQAAFIVIGVLAGIGFMNDMAEAYL